MFEEQAMLLDAYSPQPSPDDIVVGDHIVPSSDSIKIIQKAVNWELVGRTSETRVRTDKPAESGSNSLRRFNAC